jgi:hypothetical protein
LSSHPNLDVTISIIEYGEVVLPRCDGDAIPESRHIEAVLLEADLGRLLHRVLVIVVLDHQRRLHLDQLVVLVHYQLVLAAVLVALLADYITR